MAYCQKCWEHITEYKDYLDGTKQVLEESQQEKEPYLTTVSGKEFVVNPNVFSPKYFNDTELFADNLPVKKDEEMLLTLKQAVSEIRMLPHTAHAGGGACDV